ncbi:MAG: YfiR family protein [Methylotenera sp.]
MINISHKIWIKRCCQIAQFAVLMGVVSILHAATREDTIKAGIVYNFTKFIAWPEHIINHSQFNLCVFGQQGGDGFDGLTGKLALEMPLVIKRNPKDTEIHTCQIAYIKKTHKKNIEKILNKCKSLPILTVSESVNFIHHGGMIGLITHEDHIGFEANVKSINDVGINIGAQLLKLAKRVVGLN